VDATTAAVADLAAFDRALDELGDVSHVHRVEAVAAPGGWDEGITIGSPIVADRSLPRARAGHPSAGV
jgi:hypothetical protein